MKHLNRFARGVAVGLIGVGMLMLVTRASAESIPQVVRVIKVVGQAQYSTDASRTWQPLRKGDVLQPGTTIRTAERSTVDILMGDRQSTSVTPVVLGMPTASPASGGGGGSAAEEQKANIVRIFQSTVLGVDKLTVDRTGMDEMSETQLDLRAGQIMGNVKKLSATSKYEVKIPNGVAGIRGTAYLISSSGVVDVLEGSVVVAVVAADGTVTTRVVTAGHTFDPATGQVTPIPAPTIVALQKILQELGVSGMTGPTVITTDHTIIYISPLDGTSVAPGTPPAAPPAPPAPGG